MAGQPGDSEAKRDLESRHQEGGPFVQAVDATSMAMIVTECGAPGNPIIFANDSFLAMTGYSRDEVLGRNYRMLYGVDTDPETQRTIDAALHAKGDVVLESLLYRKDGRGIWVRQHVSVQRENGEVLRHFASFFDIDRRVRAEKEVRRAHDQLEQRVRRRTRELSDTVDELRRENQKRVAAEEVLRHALDDKDRLIQQREFLMREVNHRVKNTLQMATALLTVQAGTAHDPAIALSLNAAKERLERLAEVHRLLYESVDVTTRIRLDTYLADLCHHLLSASAGDGGRIRVEVDVDEGAWSADEAVPIALIVNEAVTNAVKHAFPANRAGVVNVELKDLGYDFYELVISDNGIGGETPMKAGSLGMRLIEIFARQLQGVLAIGHDSGTRIAVRFMHGEGGSR